MTETKYWRAINTALAEEMRRDERVVLIGQDVASPGGPFGATKGLMKEFGPNRVRDTPISEGAVVGAAVGAAMAGLRPVVEVMFFDFITLALDQLVNQAAKMAYMSMGHYSVPLTLRTMCGAGLGAGPQHSQNLEAWLAAVPGLKVVSPGTPAEAKGLLKAAIRDPDPVVVIESASLWSMKGEVIDDAEAVLPMGRAAVRREGSDVTLVCWGSSVPGALEAAQILAEQGVEVEVIDLRTLNPLEKECVVRSVRKTGRLVVCQNAVTTCSIGSDLIRIVATAAHRSLRVAPELVAPPFAPVPFPPGLERAYFPQQHDVVAAVHRALTEEPTWPRSSYPSGV
ncbi:alpha-ketoacid dehydrogenase subunit beta [Amycolatopsis sp. K13G38]|uniref:Alpha-ketoacid dehydrogenase subunit beta n=1 Tax=Amycolatopsis acididurans TaxID=2724524 RepID=A0ABX1J5D7_9PSEU|nr:pyruvate dehydrogenase complex E1 component subunit beta [Amycolatopsis acididurans]NKQ55008.1 alpha-ketoacid dehydrogenase subunit beta [Amycolatopsis acididurans]